LVVAIPISLNCHLSSQGRLQDLAQTSSPRLFVFRIYFLFFGGGKMKNIKSLLLVSALTASFGIGVAEAWAKDGILSSVKSGESNYCHMHFPAIVEDTLASERPVVKEPSSGDIIHFYGPCDYDPHGKEAVQTQKRDEQRRLRREYTHD